jgi:hypothetical protein
MNSAPRVLNRFPPAWPWSRCDARLGVPHLAPSRPAECRAAAEQDWHRGRVSGSETRAGDNRQTLLVRSLAVGLNVVVGILAGAEDDAADHFGCDFAVIRELLDKAGVGQWNEPDLAEGDDLEGDMWGYSGLHALRRVAAHLTETGTPPRPLEAGKATDDPLLKKAYAADPGDPAGPFDHLIYHSDCEGYYVPADFPQVIVDERAAGGYLGSSVRLLAETRRIAAALGLPEDLDPDSPEVLDACDAEIPASSGWQRYGVESHGCLRLIRAARHSIETGAAIAFC